MTWPSSGEASAAADRHVVPGRCSVLLAAPGGERHLAETIESALSQTYGDVDVVVVDDGSTDATASVIRSFGPRVHAIQQPRVGLEVARNTGLRSSTGEFVALLDSGDRWEPTRIERCIAYLRERDTDVVTTDAVVVAPDGTAHGRFYGTASRAGFEAVNQVASLARGNFVFGGVVMRRRVLRGEPFDPSLPGASDYDLWLRLAGAGVRFHLLDEPLVWHREPVRASHQPEARRMKYRALAKNIDLVAPHLETPWALQTYQAAHVALHDGDRALAGRLLEVTARDPGLPRGARIRCRGRSLAVRVGLPWRYRWDR